MLSDAVGLFRPARIHGNRRMPLPFISRRRTLLAAIVPALASAAPRSGGTLTVALRSGIKTFLPLAAIDDPTRAVLSLCHSGLVRTNGQTQLLEGVVAESWRVRDSGRRIAVRLRPGLRFSDGRPITSADVEFTVRAHLDPRSASPQRDALIFGGRPLEVRLVDPLTVEFHLPDPSALAERLLDELAILPRHALEDRLALGTLASAWGVDSNPAALVSSGPFRISAYRPGQDITLERNPAYWKTGPSGEKLPYLERIRFLFTSGEEAQLARFIAGECDLVANAGAANIALIGKYARERDLELVDLGASLDSVSLLFNLDAARASVSPSLQDPDLRSAISHIVDRQAVAKLVYFGRAVAMTSFVSPGRRFWFNDRMPQPAAEPEQIRSQLRSAGYHWDSAGALRHRSGGPIRFTMAVNSSNPVYGQIAGILAADLRKFGVAVNVAPLEFRSFVDRVLTRRDFDLAVMPLRAGNADPIADMNVLLSNGRMHLWNPAQPQPATPWEAEIDRLMRLQAAATDPAARKRAFDRVQEIVAQQSPIIPLVSPHTLLAVRRGLGNFKPSVLPNAALWNAEEIYWASPQARQ